MFTKEILESLKTKCKELWKQADNDLVADIFIDISSLEMTTAKDKDAPCWYCGEMTDSLAGNPSKWPLFFVNDGTGGECVAHHTGCVISRLKGK